ncbi:pilus assembly protein [Methylothermus subterraneus]
MRSYRFHQIGAALIVSLVMLLVMTILGVAAVQSVILEERMAGNYFDRNVAFQAAEAALRQAEAVIAANAAPFDPFDQTAFNGSNGLYNTLSGSPIDIGSTASTAVPGTSLPEVANQPVYIIELIQKSCNGSGDNALFRITARAWGRDANTVVTLQSLFRRAIACSGSNGAAPSGGDSGATI